MSSNNSSDADAKRDAVLRRMLATPKASKVGKAPPDKEGKPLVARGRRGAARPKPAKPGGGA